MDPKIARVIQKEPDIIEAYGEDNQLMFSLTARETLIFAGETDSTKQRKAGLYGTAVQTELI